MKEHDARAAIVAEALTWQQTPYHHTGRIKGAGVDCLTFIVCVAENVGLIPHIDLPPYSRQFGANRDDETYLEGLLKYCREVTAPHPGEIVLFQMGRTFSHAGIVLAWPEIIHAHPERGVTRSNATAGRLAFLNQGDGLKPRPRKFFSYW